MAVVLAVALFGSAAFALWVATSVVRAGQATSDAPGVRIFVRLLVAVAFWSALGGLHAIAASLETKVLLAQIQYFGVSTVPPLWFLFTTEYAGVAAIANRRVRAAVWVIPVAMIVAAFTNESHHAIWSNVTLSLDGFAVYDHGWAFWIGAGYSYLLVLAGTIALIRSARQCPPSFRSQFIALVCASVLPWIGNMLFLAGATRPGVDPTPIGFALAGVLIASALYRSRLFELVPVARDVVVDTLDDAVIVIDPERRVLDMNAAALRLVRPGQRWLGRAVESVLPLLGDAPCADTSSHRSRAIVSPDGAKHYEITAIPLRLPRGRTGGCVMVLRDTTGQRAAAAAHDALQARVHEQQRREGLSILAAGLAHDFNNLLTGIVGNADLLSMKIPASSELGASVSAIQLGAQRAADLVGKMLAYAGERHGSMATIDLDVLVRDVLDLLIASSARHCTVEYTGESAVIEADPTQVRQVLMNLVINAAEAVEETTGQVTVTTGSEYLSVTQLQQMRVVEDATAGHYAFVEVSDNGTGMTEQTMRRIFQPFFTTKPTGHGLGLSAVQGIVLGHRGALRVDSGPGLGSRFRVWFPLASEHVRPASAHGSGVLPDVSASADVILD